VKPVDEQLALIRRGAEQVVPEDELRKKLATGKPLRVKYGIDPTGIDVHLGHTVPLRKLRLFQEMGHQAVVIIGNYTALVGDPSGRDQTRASLTQEQVEKNAQDYLRQVSKIINIDTAEVRYNGEWFSKFSFLDVMRLMGKITVLRMLERDEFTKRYKEGTPIYLSECLYPLMQGHDSVEIRADVELGGSEQLFNLMIGRQLQTAAGQAPQICVTNPILRGLDGERRMGKSLGNYIGVGDPPGGETGQFDKTMSIPDHLMPEWFTLLTDRTAEEIARLTDPEQTHPMEAKKTLGKDIVRFYHGVAAAAAACNEWVQRFSRGQDPKDIQEREISAIDLSDGTIGIVRLLSLVGLAKSNNEARRAVEGGGVTIGEERHKVSDPKATLTVTDGLIVRVGKRNVVRVRLRTKVI